MYKQFGLADAIFERTPAAIPNGIGNDQIGILYQLTVHNSVNEYISANYVQTNYNKGLGRITIQSPINRLSQPFDGVNSIGASNEVVRGDSLPRIPYHEFFSFPVTYLDYGVDTPFHYSLKYLSSYEQLYRRILPAPANNNANIRNAKRLNAIKFGLTSADIMPYSGDNATSSAFSYPYTIRNGSLRSLSPEITNIGSVYHHSRSMGVDSFGLLLGSIALAKQQLPADQRPGTRIFASTPTTTPPTELLEDKFSELTMVAESGNNSIIRDFSEKVNIVYDSTVPLAYPSQLQAGDIVFINDRSPRPAFGIVISIGDSQPSTWATARQTARILTINARSNTTFVTTVSNYEQFFFNGAKLPVSFRRLVKQDLNSNLEIADLAHDIKRLNLSVFPLSSSHQIYSTGIDRKYCFHLPNTMEGLMLGEIRGKSSSASLRIGGAQVKDAFYKDYCQQGNVNKNSYNPANPARLYLIALTGDANMAMENGYPWEIVDNIAQRKTYLNFNITEPIGRLLYTFTANGQETVRGIAAPGVELSLGADGRITATITDGNSVSTIRRFALLADDNHYLGDNYRLSFVSEYGSELELDHTFAYYDKKAVWRANLSLCERPIENDYNVRHPWVEGNAWNKTFSIQDNNSTTVTYDKIITIADPVAGPGEYTSGKQVLNLNLFSWTSYKGTNVNVETNATRSGYVAYDFPANMNARNFVGLDSPFEFAFKLFHQRENAKRFIATAVTSPNPNFNATTALTFPSNNAAINNKLKELIFGNSNNFFVVPSDDIRTFSKSGPTAAATYNSLLIDTPTPFRSLNNTMWLSYFKQPWKINSNSSIPSFVPGLANVLAPGTGFKFDEYVLGHKGTEKNPAAPFSRSTNITLRQEYFDEGWGKLDNPQAIDQLASAGVDCVGFVMNAMQYDGQKNTYRLNNIGQNGEMMDKWAPNSQGPSAVNYQSRPRPDEAQPFFINGADGNKDSLYKEDLSVAFKNSFINIDSNMAVEEFHDIRRALLKCVPGDPIFLCGISGAPFHAGLINSIDYQTVLSAESPAQLRSAVSIIQSATSGTNRDGVYVANQLFGIFRLVRIKQE